MHLVAATPGAAQPGGPERHQRYLAEAEAEVAAELDQLAAKLAQEDRSAARLQDEAYAAYAAGDEAKGDKLHAKMMRHLNAATTLAQRRNVLATPEEAERRAQQRAARATSRARLDTYLASKEAE